MNTIFKNGCVLTLFACSILNFCLAQVSPDPIPYPIVVSVSVESGKHHTYYLDVTTEQNYNNGSTRIRYLKTRHGNTITITFNGITTPPKVVKSLEPARVRIQLGHMKQAEYQLSFINGRHVDVGTLMTNQGNPMLKFNSTNITLLFDNQ